ncbi:MAG: hypothetical protein AB8B62_16355 [Roseobacter sp.]
MQALQIAFAVIVMMLTAPEEVRGNSSDVSDVNTVQDACFLAGKAYSSGATVTVAGERLSCFRGFGNIFWVDVARNEQENDSFVFCVSEGAYYSLGAVLGDVKCTGSGNWD